MDSHPRGCSTSPCPYLKGLGHCTCIAQSMPSQGSKLATPLSGPDVLRWYENLAPGSRATADINVRRLTAYCESLEITPGGLARLDERDLHNHILDFTSAEDARGVAGSYIVRTVKAAKSWLLHNGV